MSGRVSRNLDIPNGLLRQIEAIAETDGVSTGEVVRTALERLIATRKLRRFAALGREHATRLGLTEEDVPRLIEETRKSHPR